MRNPTFQLARITIELDTPFAVGSGEGIDLVDQSFVVDANGLPTLPGTTIAGVLRHAVAAGNDPQTDPRCRDLFGFQDRRDGAASRVETSFGHVHDSNDRPVPMRGCDPHSDPVLAILGAGVRRDHVRIDERGVADERGKFDDLWVPAGARFTFEIRVDGGTDDELTELVGLLACGVLRFGRKSRSGFGGFHLVRACGRGFDLREAADREAYRRLPRAIEEPLPAGLLPALDVQPATATHWKQVQLDLEPEDLWIFGGGDPALPEHLEQDGAESRASDMVPVTEPRITWSNGRAQIEEHAIVVPGSSIKGALRHRVAFHARRLRKAFVDGDGAIAPIEEEPEVVALFGSIKARDAGQPGCVFLDDVFLPVREVSHVWLDHVSLDRFTGGARDQRLFSEVVLCGGRIPLRLRVDTARMRDPTGRALEALQCALEDLASGRLALGAGASRGHGYFRAEMKGALA